MSCIASCVLICLLNLPVEQSDIYRFGVWPYNAYTHTELFNPCDEKIRMYQLCWFAVTNHLYDPYISRYNTGYLLAIREQLGREQQCWTYLQQMRNIGYSAQTRIQAANDLRDAIGPLSYLLGRMPQPPIDELFIEVK